MHAALDVLRANGYYWLARGGMALGQFGMSQDEGSVAWGRNTLASSYFLVLVFAASVDFREKPLETPVKTLSRRGRLILLLDDNAGKPVPIVGVLLAIVVAIVNANWTMALISALALVVAFCLSLIHI